MTVFDVIDVIGFMCFDDVFVDNIDVIDVIEDIIDVMAFVVDVIDVCF